MSLFDGTAIGERSSGRAAPLHGYSKAALMRAQEDGDTAETSS